MTGSQWRVAEPDVYGCRLWLGQLDRDGYGIVWRGKGKPPARAHRLVFEERHGKLQPGEEVEHACRRRACLTDSHHVRVDRRTNERLKRWRNRVRIEKCRDGHLLALHGQITPEGGRVCRECARAEIFFGGPENQGGGG